MRLCEGTEEAGADNCVCGGVVGDELVDAERVDEGRAAATLEASLCPFVIEVWLEEELVLSDGREELLLLILCRG